MDETIAQLEAAQLPNLAEVYRAIKARNIEALAWRISAEHHRIKFFIETLMEKRFQVSPDTKLGTYLKLKPHETMIRFGGLRKAANQEQKIPATEFISLLATEIMYFPDHIRRTLNEICGTMLPFSEPFEVPKA